MRFLRAWPSLGFAVVVEEEEGDGRFLPASWISAMLAAGEGEVGVGAVGEMRCAGKVSLAVSPVVHSSRVSGALCRTVEEVEGGRLTIANVSKRKVS